MVKLTEEMIVARTRVSDMANVKKLNCWGAELTDVSVLRKLTNVEVLSLSVNCISSLSDLQKCVNLQELYIRKNKIEDLSELCWLTDLDNLRYLWLEENPCVNISAPHYRLTVLRALPQLQKLDNVVVQPDERADALRRGQDLVHPMDRQPVMSIQQRPSRTSMDSLGSRHLVEMGGNEEEEEDNRRRYAQSRGNSVDHDMNNCYTPSRRSSSNGPMSAMEASHIPQEYQSGRRLSHQERRSPTAYRGLSTATPEDPSRRMSLQDLGYEDEGPRRNRVNSNYTDSNNTGYNSHGYGYQGGNYDQLGRQEEIEEDESFASISTSRLATVSEASKSNTQTTTLTARNTEGQESPRRPPSGSVNNFEHYVESAERMVGRASISSTGQRRPRNRNSNILSAILCLIKELDGPSLEVVETAARCRIEELHE